MAALLRGYKPRIRVIDFDQACSVKTTGQWQSISTRTIYLAVLTSRLVNKGVIWRKKKTFSLQDQRGKSRAGKVSPARPPARVANQKAGFASSCTLADSFL